MALDLPTSDQSEDSPFTEVSRPPSRANSGISELSALSNDCSAVGDPGAPKTPDDRADTETGMDTFHSAGEDPTGADVQAPEAIASVAPPVSAASSASIADPTAEVNPNGEDPEKWSARYYISCLADGLASLYSKGCSAYTATKKRVGPWVSAAWTGTTNQFSTASKYVSSKYTSIGGPTAMESVKKGVSSIWTGITHAAAWTRDNVGPMISSGWTKGKHLYSRAPSMSKVWHDGPSMLSATYQSAKGQLVRGCSVVQRAGSYWLVGTGDKGKSKAE